MHALILSAVFLAVVVAISCLIGLRLRRWHPPLCPRCGQPYGISGTVWHGDEEICVWCAEQYCDDRDGEREIEWRN